VKKIAISFLIVFSAFAFSLTLYDAQEIGQLREVLEEASRTSQKVFVEEFTGIS